MLLGASPNGLAEKLKTPTLFIVARDAANAEDDGFPAFAQYGKAPEPKELLVLDGSAHAQFLFQTN